MEDIKRGDLFLQRGVQKISIYFGEIVGVDYVKENLVPSDSCIDMIGIGSYIDVNGAASIYQLCGYDLNGFKINQYNINKREVFELDNVSLDELNKRFIRLSDYLKDALFVGREFRRIQPSYRYSKCENVDDFLLSLFSGRNYWKRREIIKREYSVIEDISFIGIDKYSKNIVLYMKDNIFLVKYTGRFGEGYRIIDCSYTWDGNYEFYGDVYEEYSDRNKVYSEIVKQLKDYDSKFDKRRVRKR